MKLFEADIPHGRAAGGPKRHVVGVKITPDERIALERMARERGAPLSAVIRSGLAREHTARTRRRRAA